MKKTALFLFALLLVCGAAHARETMRINRDWRFFMNSEGSGDRASRVNLPHTWNNDALSGKRDYTRGIGNYVKDIEIPASWRGKRIFFRSYGANTVTTLLVNGRTAGEHWGGYTAFAFEITDLVVPGKENTLWLMVNNSPHTGIMPTAGDMNVYGGCFRTVELIATDRIAISPLDHGSSGIYVRPEEVSDMSVSGTVEVAVTGLADKTVYAVAAVFTNDGDTVARHTDRVRIGSEKTASLEIPFEFDNPTLWNGRENPYLYNVGVTLVSEGRKCDSLVVHTGFRYYSITADGGFSLNGKPYKLRGVNTTQDRAMSGPAIMRYQAEEDLRIIYEMGANAVRVMGVPHHPRFYELCDAYGMIVWSDLPWIGNAYLTDRQFLDTPTFRRSGKYLLTEIIRQQYNHPSIVVWGLFSDLTMRGDNPVEYVRELNDLAKKTDPSRLTGATSSEDGELNFVTDVILWNHSLGWKDGYPDDIGRWLKQLHGSWRNLRSALSYSAGGSIYQQDDSLYKPSYLGNWHPEGWQTHFHERYMANISRDSLLWGVFVGNMFDYGAAGRDWGEGNGINDAGLVTFDRKYRKDAYYLYKANWNDREPVVYIAEKRWERRPAGRHDFKVYSNSPEVELFVNGVSQGVRKRTDDSRFIWIDIELQRGTNRIEARGDGVWDTAFIFAEGASRSGR